MSKKDLEKAIQIVLDNDYKEMEKLRNSIADLAKQNKKYKEVIDKLNQINNLFPKTDFSHDYMIYRNKVEEILKEVD